LVTKEETLRNTQVDLKEACLNVTNLEETISDAKSQLQVIDHYHNAHWDELEAELATARLEIKQIGYENSKKVDELTDELAQVKATLTQAHSQMQHKTDKVEELKLKRRKLQQEFDTNASESEQRVMQLESEVQELRDVKQHADEKLEHWELCHKELLVAEKTTRHLEIQLQVAGDANKEQQTATRDLESQLTNLEQQNLLKHVELKDSKIVIHDLEAHIGQLGNRVHETRLDRDAVQEALEQQLGAMQLLRSGATDVKNELVQQLQREQEQLRKAKQHADDKLQQLDTQLKNSQDNHMSVRELELQLEMALLTSKRETEAKERVESRLDQKMQALSEKHLELKDAQMAQRELEQQVEQISGSLAAESPSMIEANVHADEELMALNIELKSMVSEKDELQELVEDLSHQLVNAHAAAEEQTTAHADKVAKLKNKPQRAHRI